MNDILFTRTTPLISQFGDPAVLALACAKYVGVQMNVEPTCSVATAAEGVNYNPSDITVIQGIGDALRFFFCDDFDFGTKKDSARPYLLSRLFSRLPGYGAGTYQVNIKHLYHRDAALAFDFAMWSTDPITDHMTIFVTKDGVWEIDFHTHFDGHHHAKLTGKRGILRSSFAGKKDNIRKRLVEVYGLGHLLEGILV